MLSSKIFGILCPQWTPASVGVNFRSTLEICVEYKIKMHMQIFVLPILKRGNVMHGSEEVVVVKTLLLERVERHPLKMVNYYFKTFIFRKNVIEKNKITNYANQLTNFPNYWSFVNKSILGNLVKIFYFSEK